MDPAVNGPVGEEPGEAGPSLVPHLRWEGEDVRRWARWWGIPALEVHHALPSTNDRLRHWALEGAEPFSVVLAETQTAGRGRGGREWHSPTGMGLWVSVLLESPGAASALPILPLRVGMALARAVEVAVPPLRPGIKWPNDLFVDGRKAAGILCEVVQGPGGPAVVAGVGINLRQEPGDFPPDLRRGAVSLAMAAGYPPDRPFLLGSFLSLLRSSRSAAGPLLSAAERETLQAMDVLRGRTVQVEPGATGIARGVAGDGALLVDEGGDVPRRVLAGSVRLVDAPTG